MNNKEGIIEKSICKIDEFGDKYWYLNGKLHRENDLPAVEYIDGTKWWCLNGECHRENDKPAIECANGDKEWCLNSKYHREKGPAIKCINGRKAWYWNGKYIEVNSQEEFEDKLPYLIMKDFYEQ